MTIRRSAGVTPEINLRNPLCACEEACKQGIHPDSETLGRRHQKSKTWELMAIQKGLVSSKHFKKFLRFPHAYWT